MRHKLGGFAIFSLLIILVGPLVRPARTYAQEASAQNVAHGSAKGEQVDTAGLAALIRQLQTQVQDLGGQLKEVKAQQQSAQAESTKLRKELEQTRSQVEALKGGAGSVSPAEVATLSTSGQAVSEERVARLEESVQMSDAKIAEQSQTKVESASKYRLRLNGIVLLNMFGNRGSVDNADFPLLATPPGPLASGGSFGGTLRQSQIGLEAFGPTIAGAHTSANINFDFAGGLAQVPNGASFGFMRLRTGTIRFDWENTSVIAGQDSLFFTPLTPTSITSLAIPTFAYSGTLWNWTPQIRLEHRFALTESSTLTVVGGLLDPLSGDVPFQEYNRSPTWGEYSGQPAYAARVALSHPMFGQTLTAGLGGYYSRQIWGYGRSVDSWASTMDLTVPLGRIVEFSGSFYRGRALGGLGGGIGQSVLWNGSLLNPSTEVYGLDSMGGWAQLKFRITPKLQLNGAFGMDNPFASQLRENGGNATFYGAPVSRNQTVLANFIYHPRSDVVLSLEYRRLNTSFLPLGGEGQANSPNTANQINFSVGYIF